MLLPLLPRPGPWAPAIIRPMSSRAMSGVTVPTIRPSYMTAIRSDRAKISSSSVDTMTTAVPLSRSAMIRLWMNSIDPTSTPRVGWEAIRTFSGRENSRATTTFCWLPPESELTGALHRLGADVELLDPVRGVLLERVQPQGQAAGELLVAVEVEDEVLARR